MELKYYWELVIYSKFTGFNRTFMELKSAVGATVGRWHKSFNRTFMELKYWKKDYYTSIRPVSIVPLWN